MILKYLPDVVFGADEACNRHTQARLTPCSLFTRVRTVCTISSYKFVLEETVGFNCGADTSEELVELKFGDTHMSTYPFVQNIIARV